MVAGAGRRIVGHGALGFEFWAFGIKLFDISRLKTNFLEINNLPSFKFLLLQVKSLNFDVQSLTAQRPNVENDYLCHAFATGKNKQNGGNRA